MQGWGVDISSIVFGSYGTKGMSKRDCSATAGCSASAPICAACCYMTAADGCSGAFMLTAETVLEIDAATIAAITNDVFIDFSK